MNEQQSDHHEGMDEILHRISHYCASAEARKDFQALQRQIDSLLAEREGLQRAVLEDPLTSVGNRRGFEFQFRRAFATAVRYQQPLSLIIVDVNNFKGINDRWGHIAGDQVLRRVARLMHDGLRSADYVARYGGDEFVAILPSTDPAGVDQLTTRLQYELNQPLQWHDSTAEPCVISVSVGIGTASLQESDKNEWDLFRRCDESLIAVKRDVRNA